MPLNFERNPDSVTVNQRAKYIGGKRSFSSQLINADTQTQTRWTDCCTWTTKVINRTERLTSELIDAVGRSSDLAAGSLADGLLDGVAWTRSTTVEWCSKDASNSSLDACTAPHATRSPVVPLVRQHAVHRCTPQTQPSHCELEVKSNGQYKHSRTGRIYRHRRFYQLILHFIIKF